MASKRLGSPGRICLMGEIYKLVAEPVSNKKKAEANLHPGRVINHDYCVMCRKGGEIVCCDRCPKSFHINCHVPAITKLPAGEWFCRGCTLVENDELNSEVPNNDDIGKTENDSCQNEFMDRDKFEVDMLPSHILKIIGNCDSPKSMIFTDIKVVLKRQFDMLRSCKIQGVFLPEIPYHPRYNVRLHSRKQLDKQKLVRKNERCHVCKRCVLRGRLVQCDYCYKLYHLNCLDPPIRDWDHSTKYMCSLHDNFFELEYPDIFPPGSKSSILANAITMKRIRCELPSLPINTLFSIPSHIYAMYTKREENIPTITDNYSLNILCDVASSELESINSNKINYNDISNISTELLACQHANELQTNNCLIFKQPTATLTCLSLSTKPINIFSQTKSFTIGKSPNNNLCLLPYGNCEFISDCHATITFDDKLGNYFMRNHSKHGITVDNVSYFGNYQPKEDILNIRELKQINSQFIKHINKQRKTVRRHGLLYIYRSIENDKMKIKYVGKKRKFDYRSMFKYYTNKFSNIKHTYQKIQCNCNKRFLLKSGYAGQAVLRNETIMSIGCLKFKFTYSMQEVPNMYTQDISKYVMNGERKPLNGLHIQFQTEQEENIVTKGFQSLIPLVTVVSKYGSLKEIAKVEAAEDKNVYLFNEQNIVNHLDMEADSVNHVFSNNNTEIDDMIQNNDNVVLTVEDLNDDNIQIKEDIYDNDLLTMEDIDDDSMSTVKVDDDNNIMILNDAHDSVLILDNNINYSSTPNDINTNVTDSLGNLQPRTQFWDDINSDIQSCYTNDLIQEVVMVNCSENKVEEQTVYEYTDNNITERVVTNSPEWLIEEIVVNEDGKPVNQEPQPGPSGQHRDFKTEHLYCARSPSADIPTIIISSDDEYYGYDD